jgi:hypothetical protein
VYAVRLLNKHNHTFLDRGAKEVVVEGYYKKRRVWKGSVSFERVTSERDWKRLDLGGVRVDKLHFEVISYFGSGLALAEIVVE